MKFFFLFGLGFFSAIALGFDEFELKRVSESKAWHRLLHYRRTFPFGKLRSEVDGEGFFFSKEGKTEPLLELKASIGAFSQDINVGKFQLHPQCAFPARFEFLNQAFNLKLPKRSCPEFEEALKNANPDSVSLIFSSAYPNNPASMFGHTFLRLNKKVPAGQRKQDMLDYGLSFAATVAPDENPLAFIAFGLTGGYRGQFSYMPYYVKLNEYNNSESRDLWEYDLNLSAQESRFLLAHVWELETNSYFNYFFFDENCSYQMLTVLEAVKPDWDLTDFSISVIPSETIKKIMSIPGAVENVKYRPSLRKKMIHQVNHLNPNQKQSLGGVLNSELPPNQIQDPFVLDAAIASLFYDKNEKEGQIEEIKKQLQTSLLLQRSRISGTASTPNTIQDESNRPDLGHFAQRVSLSSGGVSQPSYSGLFQEVGIKTAYHDLMNKDLGFLPFSQIDFPQVYFRYFPSTQDLFLENLELLHITSLFPLSFIEKRPSWKLQLGYGAIKDADCLGCRSFQIKGGLGFAFSLMNEKQVLYGLLLARAEKANHFERGFRIGPEAQLATLFTIGEDLKMRFAASSLWDAFSIEASQFLYQADWEAALSLSQSWEIRLGLSAWWNAARQSSRMNQEGKLTLNYYF